LFAAIDNQEWELGGNRKSVIGGLFDTIGKSKGEKIFIFVFRKLFRKEFVLLFARIACEKL
jgi:hypothetical protein